MAHHVTMIYGVMDETSVSVDNVNTSATHAAAVLFAVTFVTKTRTAVWLPLEPPATMVSSVTAQTFVTAKVIAFRPAIHARAAFVPTPTRLAALKKAHLLAPSSTTLTIWPSPAPLVQLYL